MPTRADRGLERYNPDTNLMEIGGVGIGAEGSRRQGQQDAVRAARSAWPSGRTTRPCCAPASASPTIRSRWRGRCARIIPAVLNLLVDAPNTFRSSARRRPGSRRSRARSRQRRRFPVPSPITVFTLPDEFERGHIKSWNAAFQRELGWGFVGRGGLRRHAADRSARLQRAELVADRRRAGRTPVVSAVRPHRPDPPDRADRRQRVRRAADPSRSPVRNGFQFGVSYTCSKSTGIAGNANSDGALRINIPEFYDLNDARSTTSTAPTAEHHQHRGAALRHRAALAVNGGVLWRRSSAAGRSTTSSASTAARRSA